MNMPRLSSLVALGVLLGGCSGPEFTVPPTRAAGQCDPALIGAWHLPDRPQKTLRVHAGCRVDNTDDPGFPFRVIHTGASPRPGERLAWLQAAPDEGGRWLLLCYRIEGQALYWGTMDSAATERAIKAGAIRGQLPSGPHNGAAVAIIEEPIEAWPPTLRNDACRVDHPDARLVRAEPGAR